MPIGDFSGLLDANPIGDLLIGDLIIGDLLIGDLLNGDLLTLLLLPGIDLIAFCIYYVF